SVAIGAHRGVAALQPGQNQDNADLRSTLKEGLRTIGNRISEFGVKLSTYFTPIDVTQTRANFTPGAPSAPIVPRVHVEAGYLKTFKEESQKSDLYNLLPSTNAENGALIDPHLNREKFDENVHKILTSPKALAVMIENKLTITEAVAIRMYTTGGFTTVNANLRGEVRDQATDELTKQFTNGLAKLPSFDGNPITGPGGKTYHQCFRGFNFNNNTVNLMEKGTGFGDRGIMSTSSDPSKDFQYNGVLTVLLKPGSQGKDISMFSQFSSAEAEVAFPPDVTFKVVDRVKTEHEDITVNPNRVRHNVLLKEV
ncbi:MAG: ADP-ribosyltransferase, partial [Shinella sp.]